MSRAQLAAIALAAIGILFLTVNSVGDRTWNGLTFAYIGIFLVLKAGLIGKQGPIGVSLALTNFAIGTAYAWAGFVSFWPDSPLAAHWLLWLLRSVVCLAVTWSGALLLRIWWVDRGRDNTLCFVRNCGRIWTRTCKGGKS